MPTPATQPIPDGMHTITPHLTCDNAAQAIEFYAKAFGASVLSRLAGHGGSVMHASLKIGDSVIMLAESNPDCGAKSPKTLNGSSVALHIYTKDVDAAFDTAVAAGATVIMPVTDMFWGDRYGQVEDPFGHRWSLATHKRDMTHQEIEDEMRKFMGA